MARWAIPEDLHSRITQGPLCPHNEHSFGSLDGQIPRYDDSHACVRCISSLTEGRLDLSIRAVHPRWRRKFLEFWSLVDIGEPDECWLWMGPRYKDNSSSYFPIDRHWSASRQFAPTRIATWFTWGDIGLLPIDHLCGEKLCCNPLHIRIRGVPHFHHRRKLSSIELAPKARRLVNDTQEFLIITRDQAPDRFRRLEKLGAEWIRARAEADSHPS